MALRARRATIPRHGGWSRVVIVAILGVALLLRLRGLDFGLPALLDPDEPIFVLIGLKLLKNHTLNPGWFGHPGTITIYTLALIEIGVYLVGSALGWFSGAQGFAHAFYFDPGIVFLPGRVAMLLAGLAVVYLTWRLGRQVLGPRVGWLAAALVAVDPVHVRYSQIIRTDMQASVFILLALLAAGRIVTQGSRRSYLWAGVAIGAACATKWPGIAAAAGVIGAAAWRWWQFPGERATVLRRGGLFLVVTVVALIAISPFLVLDFPTVLSNLHGEGRAVHLGATGGSAAWNLWWYLSGPLADAFGWAGLLAIVAGGVVGCKASPTFRVVLVPAAGAIFLSLLVQHLVWERWIVPLIPLFSIAAAAGAIGLFDALRRRAARLAPVMAALGLVALFVPPLWVADVQARERQVDTRRLATAWAVRHFAPDSTVAVEYLAFDALRQPWRFLYPAGDRGCVDVRANLSGQISVHTIDGWRSGRSIVDLGGIAPHDLATCRADYVIIDNYDRYVLEAQRFPDEIAGYRRLLAGSRQVAMFVPQPGVVGGPVVRIFERPRS